MVTGRGEEPIFRYEQEQYKSQLGSRHDSMDNLIKDLF